MGNQCNFTCEYCPPVLHDGTKPWLPLESYITAVDRICSHYADIGKSVHFELIGGEVTVMAGFEDIIRKINEYGCSSVAFTNASRTINWWSKAKHYLNGVVITWHPHSMDKQHLIDVINEIKDYVNIDINIAGIGGRVDELGNTVEELRELFKDCQRNNYNNVSICVKTMYKKLLGRDSKQETYWPYTDYELEIIKRPGIKPMPMPMPNPDQPVFEPDPRDWMTEFLYDNGEAKYVQSHQIINEGLNKFKGMSCYLGFESLTIDASGDIYSSWCGAKHFGNIAKLESWELPKSLTVCPYDFCNNISDIAISKVG
jgi:hypothetical protein